MKNNHGFTLIELILVIAILGILAVAVAPQFVDIQASANAAQAKGVVGATRDGINMSYARLLATTGTGSYPSDLESTAGTCDGSGACFDEVLKNYPSTNWTESPANTYTHSGSGCVFTYVSASGTFSVTTDPDGLCAD